MYIYTYIRIYTYTYIYIYTSICCIQAAQDHSKPLRSKGRSQRQDQPGVDATYSEHTPRLSEPDVSENSMPLMFSKGQNKNNGSCIGLFLQRIFWKQTLWHRFLHLMNKHLVLSPVYPYIYLYRTFQERKLKMIGCTNGQGEMWDNLADLARFTGRSSNNPKSDPRETKISSSFFLGWQMHLQLQHLPNPLLVPSILRDTNKVFASRTASNSIYKHGFLWMGSGRY